MAGPLKIGELAKRTGVSVDTIRFYERRGVLPPPRRRASGYRVYDESVVERVQLVRALQTLGLHLDEIIDALAAMDAGQPCCASQQERIEQAVARLDAEIAVLAATRQRAARVLSRCRSGDCKLEVCGC